MIKINIDYYCKKILIRTNIKKLIKKISTNLPQNK